MGILGCHFAQRAAEHGRVIGINRHVAPADLSEAAYHTVAGDPPLLHAESVRAVGGEDVQLHKAAFVQQRVDALARGELALRPPLLERRAARVQHAIALLPIGVELLFRD